MSPPVLVLLAAVFLALPAPAGAAPWRRPVPGTAVAAPFRFDPRVPYARGARRGIDLRARAGTPVVAACSGHVAFAGRVPRFGLGVTLRCGRLVATELGLARVVTRRGSRVRRGAVLGAARGGVLRLGARRFGARHGYVDPAVLLGGEARRRVAPPAIVARARARRPPPPAPVAAPSPGGAPALAWLGLAAAVPGAAGGGLVRRRRRRAAAPGTALAPR